MRAAMDVLNNVRTGCDYKSFSEMRCLRQKKAISIFKDIFMDTLLSYRSQKQCLLHKAQLSTDCSNISSDVPVDACRAHSLRDVVQRELTSQLP
jgi:hypothetical protein